jgi:hypothetical protein
MGKKSTTVNTGLGDAQYTTLASNQQNIAASIDDGFNNAAQMGANLQSGQETITQNQGVLAENQGTMLENQGTIIGNQNALSTGQQNLTAGQDRILQAVQSAPTVDLSGVTSSINSLEGTTQAGFNNMGSRFDSVDSTLGTISGEVTGLGSRIDTGFEGVNNNMTAQFEQNAAARQAQFDQAEANRAAMQELILTGQVSMTDLINKYGEAGATYYADLANNQAVMMDQNAGLQQGLTAFQDTYNQNVDMEAKRFGELQDQVTGGFDAVRGGQSDLSSAVSGVKDAVATQAAAGSQAVYGAGQQQQTQQQAIDYARIAKEVATGVADQTDGGFTNGQMFASKLDTIRNILTNQGDQLDFRIRDQYTRLANSFDSQGKLIASSVDQNGIQTARAIDQQGNLLMAQFDQTGQRLMQDSMNMNQMLAAFDQQMRFQMGGNYAMGNLSPAYNRGKGGLASPYSYSYR